MEINTIKRSKYAKIALTALETQKKCSYTIEKFGH
jgi:hypothetical protein